MKIAPFLAPALLALLLSAPAAGRVQFSPGQNFLGGLPPSGLENAFLAASAPDSAAFANGTRAINESRWTDAVAIFTKVAQKQSAHADGALYWKAYAENKLGQTNPALGTCAQLRSGFPSSSWIHECGALEIEMRAKSGQPAQPKAEPDESLRLLALNELMKKDEPRALAELQEILVGDASEKLKKEAQFILGQHYSNASYAQIARISYLEGDVSINRGWKNEETTGATWEKAVANLPLETGYSLVTGAGRAEIEFEDASTLYLGDHSVLLFNDLHTASGIPYTQLALLSGTVTLHVQPYVGGEVFILKTPTGSVTAKYPEKFYLRVGSYSDGFTINALNEIDANHSEIARTQASVPQSSIHYEGHRVVWLGFKDSGAFADWDKWVQYRVALRSAAIAEVMQASGLNEPIPGMAEMKGQGNFFECRPYGTCWEPHAAQPQKISSLPASGPTAASASQKAQSSGHASAPLLPVRDDSEFFPCFPLHSFDDQTYRSENHFHTRIIDSSYQLRAYSYPYNWAVCHDGGWVQMRNHYVWVAGRKRHHLGPGRWIKSGNTVAFIPIHPWDVKSRPPINHFEEVLALSHKHGLEFERAKLDPAGPIKLLDAPPKEFDKAIYPALDRAEEPNMEIFMLKDAFFAGDAGNRSKAGINETPAKPVGIPLKFDQKTRSFMMTQRILQGNRIVTRSVPFDNHSGSTSSSSAPSSSSHH